MNKPPGKPCKHITATGCEIYDDRPQSCSDFGCLWLAGSLESHDRPDKVGIVATTAPVDRRLHPRGFVVALYPVFPGATNTAKGRALLDRLASIGQVALIYSKPGGPVTAIYPDGVRQAEAFRSPTFEEELQDDGVVWQQAAIRPWSEYQHVLPPSVREAAHSDGGDRAPDR